MKIVIDDKIPFIRGAFERWADVVYAPGSSIDAWMVADADALIVRTRTKCNAGLLEGSNVRIVASATIGFDHIDTAWLEQHGIKWANAPGCNSGSVMQYITALLLFLAQKHSLDLQSLTLGIVGVGNVGSKVARAAQTLGVRVLLNDPPRQRREEGSISSGPGKAGGTEFHPLDKLLKESDILTLHVPLNREGEDKTFHLLGRHNIPLMKRDAIVINSSRGEVVDNIALRDALKEGSLRGAALDVWEGEPDTDPELVALTDIATPHIAGYSVDGKANATINSVRVVAAELGLPMRGWQPEGLPQPAEPVIDLAGVSESSLDAVTRAVFHSYPIVEDDRLFRNGREKFEYIRDNYRIRREFGSYSVRTESREAGHILHNLGFQIIE
ncbi:MAG: 4-phosphoerythronate dehydrogenase [Bacteroidales bacterium]